jgi:hypothetical protein
MYITDLKPALCTAHSRLLVVIRASLGDSCLCLTAARGLIAAPAPRVTKEG